ncbi:hypothetical protein [Streptomyces melanogenes]|uniref:hypothetical protein n=1 Tax=Streptomyces melanogenes TaxID=67326 RepID=UPI0037B758E6
MIHRADASGAGPAGRALLTEITQAVLERALDDEMTEHLGYEGVFQKRRSADDVIAGYEAIACSDTPRCTTAMFRSGIEHRLLGTGAGVALLEALITTVTGAASATVGVLVGGIVTRRGQDQQWSRDQQLVAYQELLSHYSRFTMVIKRAHADHRGWD